MEHTSFTIIGKIHSELKRLEDCPRQESEQAPEATLVLHESFADAATDLRTGDKLILLTWLHQGKREELKTRPRNNPKALMTGVFSTRSPNRPNPIGLHQVKIKKCISPLEWRLSAIEVLDGTPIIDIKPVL
ncbi:MAG: tRNA (N6-threonylcarbamoyladenosine(37)-N6)-methyltransferase TrmO [Bacteroidetes bacterium]|nr:tRNA (N6-threonylcarbamoyladenosine(37)-N6)-methyltransferase TrmO [Bacteroidota bacterium]